jgi:hypothetical protein
MPDIANKRGLNPFFDGEMGVGSQADSFGALAPAAGMPAALDARTLDAKALDRARRLLDGVGGLGWSVIGFIVGAVFWHFIGFWGFLSEVVLAGGPIGVIERSAVHSVPQFQSRPRWVEMADASPPACTTLLLDRETGITSSRPCDGNPAPPLAHDAFQGREDRIVSSRSASAIQDTLQAADRAAP